MFVPQKAFLLISFAFFAEGTEQNLDLRVLNRRIVAPNFSKINYENVGKYKGIHENGTGIALCYGKSLDLYKYQSRDTRGQKIVVAGNNLVFRSKVPIDYLFLGVAGRGRPKGYDTSYIPNKKEVDSFKSCKKKFFATYRNEPLALSIIPRRKDALAARYEVNKGATFTSQLENLPFGMKGSSTQMHVVMQFLLYTGLRHIILVGCDSSNTGYAKRINFQKKGLQKFAKAEYGWKIMAEFVKKEYPRTIIQVHNPVGLKAMKAYGWDFSEGEFVFY